MTETCTANFRIESPSRGAGRPPAEAPTRMSLSPPGRAVAEGVPATTPARARRFVRQLLRDAGPAAATDGEADALLAVSELVTNANLHGGGVTAFTARTEAAPPATDRSTVDDRTPRLRLRVVVEDADSRPPRSHPRALLDPARPGGRGWALVTRLAATCEVTVLPGGGKRISVTLAL